MYSAYTDSCFIYVCTYYRDNVNKLWPIFHTDNWCLMESIFLAEVEVKQILIFGFTSESLHVECRQGCRYRSIGLFIRLVYVAINCFTEYFWTHFTDNFNFILYMSPCYRWSREPTISIPNCGNQMLPPQLFLVAFSHHVHKRFSFLLWSTL